MTTIDYTRPSLTDYQKAIIDDPARFTVTEAATKTGKTASHVIWLMEQAIECGMNPQKREVTMKEDGGRVIFEHNKDFNLKVKSVWWIAPVFGQAEIAYRRMKGQVSDQKFFKANDTKLTLINPLGVMIQFRSADRPDNLYGDDVYAAVFDEFTRAREEAWFALRSTLTATKAKCKFIGNVKGKKNWGYVMARKALTGSDPNYSYHKLTAYDAAAAGILDLDEIEQAKRDLPDHVFKELYLAEASDDGSNPFGDKFIKLCAVGMSTLPPVCFGIDLAKSSDYTVIIGLDKFGQVCYFDRFQMDWRLTVQRILLLADIPMEIDSTGVGDPIVEEIQQHRNNVVGKKFTLPSKQQLMEGLAMGIHQRKVLLPESPGQKLPAIDHPGHIVNELENFTFEVTRTGTRYTAPSGFHDDCVMALGLAWELYPTASQYGQYNWV